MSELWYFFPLSNIQKRYRVRRVGELHFQTTEKNQILENTISLELKEWEKKQKLGSLKLGKGDVQLYSM